MRRDFMVDDNDTQEVNAGTSPFSISVYANPHEWLFARGCPPPLRESRAWVRGIRATTLLAILGCLAGILSGILCGLLQHQFNHQILAALIGAMFGLFVLVPIARWSGRGYLAFGLVGWGASAISCMTLLPRYSEYHLVVFVACLAAGLAMTARLVHGFRQVNVTVLPIVCATLSGAAVYVSPFWDLTPTLVPPEFQEQYRSTMLIALIVALFGIGLSGPFWLPYEVEQPIRISSSSAIS